MSTNATSGTLSAIRTDGLLFESLTGAATIANALSEATIKDVEAGNIRINGASERVSLTAATAKSIEQVRAR